MVCVFLVKVCAHGFVVVVGIMRTHGCSPVLDEGLMEIRPALTVVRSNNKAS